MRKTLHLMSTPFLESRRHKSGNQILFCMYFPTPILEMPCNAASVFLDVQIMTLDSPTSSRDVHICF